MASVCVQTSRMSTAHSEQEHASMSCTAALPAKLSPSPSPGAQCSGVRHSEHRSSRATSAERARKRSSMLSTHASDGTWPSCRPTAKRCNATATVPSAVSTHHGRRARRAPTLSDVLAATPAAPRRLRSIAAAAEEEGSGARRGKQRGKQGKAGESRGKQ